MPSQPSAARVTLPQRRAKETRQRLLDAAYSVFARRGFGAATVDEIASEADVSMGSLYHHFPSKEELFRAILSQHVESAQIELGSLLQASSRREAIELFVSYWFEHYRHELEFCRLFSEFVAQAAREPWAAEVMTGFFGRSRALLAEALRAAQAARLMRRDLDVEAAATLILATVEGIGVFYAIDPMAVDIDARTLTAPWVDMIERFIAGDETPDVAMFRERAAAILGAQQGPQEEGGA